MRKTKPAKLTEVDREALERAIEMSRQRGEAHRQQLDSMLKDRPWREVAEFAAYGCQCETLKLRPWQTPPCMIEDPDLEGGRAEDHHGHRRAARLLLRLLDAGLSKYEPDPIGALERAEVLA